MQLFPILQLCSLIFMIMLRFTFPLYSLQSTDGAFVRLRIPPALVFGMLSASRIRISPAVKRKIPNGLNAHGESPPWSPAPYYEIHNSAVTHFPSDDNGFLMRRNNSLIRIELWNGSSGEREHQSGRDRSQLYSLPHSHANYYFLNLEDKDRIEGRAVRGSREVINASEISPGAHFPLILSCTLRQGSLCIQIRTVRNHREESSEDWRGADATLLL